MGSVWHLQEEQFSQQWAWDAGRWPLRCREAQQGVGKKFFIRSVRPCILLLSGQWGLRGKGCGDCPKSSLQEHKACLLPVSQRPPGVPELLCPGI